MSWDKIIQFSGYKDVKLSEESKVAHIQLVRDERRPVLCYKCGSELTKIHSFQRMQVDDLPILEMKTLLNFRRLKGRCSGCKRIRLESVSFLSPTNPKMTSRFSFLLYKMCAIAPVKNTAEVLGRSSSTFWRNDLKLLEEQFSKYEIPDVRLLSVDEVYARVHHGEDESHSDRFFTVITDLDRRKVVWVGLSRRGSAFDESFKLLGPERCAKIEAVATDEHGEYGTSMEKFCTNALHIFDRFHFTMHLENAVNDTRKILRKMLPGSKVHSLAATKYRFIFGKRASSRSAIEANHIDKIREDNEAFISLEIAKERLLTFFDTESEEEAVAIFLEAEKWIKESGLNPMLKFCKKARRKWAHISSYFMCKISTGVCKGINNVIKATKRRAYGFRNMRYFMLKIMQISGMLSSKYMDLSGNWTSAGREMLLQRKNV